KRLFVQDAAAPSARKLQFIATGPELLVGSPGGAGNPLAVGATVELFNPVTGETATTSLPPLGWKPLGSETYVYSDLSQLLGPCTGAKLPGRRDASFGTRVGGLSLACKGALLGFTLDEPTQGALGLRFSVGPIEQCFVLGGTIVQDRPATSTKTGLFLAK